MKTIDSAAVYEIILRTHKMLFPSREPIFAKNTKNISSIDYLLSIPFNEFGGKEIYPDDADKLAALFYYTIKDHRFENGNKRSAIILMLALAYENNIGMVVLPDQLYNLALSVSESSSKYSDKVKVLLGKVFNIFMRLSSSSSRHDISKLMSDIK